MPRLVFLSFVMLLLGCRPGVAETLLRPDSRLTMDDLLTLTGRAENGDVAAQYYLGNMYIDGDGITHDDAQAMKWFRRAAAQGHREAELSVGQMYENGEGVPQDRAEAMKWFRRAAEQGDAEAQLKIAGMYREGRQIGRDYVQAYKWYGIAARSDDPYARKVSAAPLADVAKKITAAQKTAADRQIRSWKPAPAGKY